jgi:hypothetical protein
VTDQIKISERTNVVQAQKFRAALEKAMLGYTNKQISTAEMIARLLELAMWATAEWACWTRRVSLRAKPLRWHLPFIVLQVVSLKMFISLRGATEIGPPRVVARHKVSHHVTCREGRLHDREGWLNRPLARLDGGGRGAVRGVRQPLADSLARSVGQRQVGGVDCVA